MIVCVSQITSIGRPVRRVHALRRQSAAWRRLSPSLSGRECRKSSGRTEATGRFRTHRWTAPTKGRPTMENFLVLALHDAADPGGIIAGVLAAI
jgi:hypothetical protein